MSVVSEIRDRAEVRRRVSLELGAIALMWVLLFAAAYSLASGAGSHGGVATSVLATGSPAGAGAVVGGAAAQTKSPTLVTLPSVPTAPALKLVATPPKRKPRVTVVVSAPVRVTPVVPVVSRPSVPVAPVIERPVTVPPASSGTHRTSSGSGGSSSSSQTGTVSGGG